MRTLFAGVLGVAVGVIGTLAMHRPSPGQVVGTTAATDSTSAYAGIAALHRADSVATIARDPKLLAELWDSAAVRLEAGGPPTVTRAAIIAGDSAFFARHPGVGVVQYAPHYHPPIVNGNSAVEWGSFDAQYVSKPGTKPVSFRANVLRVLRRQPNGDWKFTHVIWNRAG